MPLTLLLVSSETPDQQMARRKRSGAASHETYADTLRAIEPDCVLSDHCCVDGSDGPGDLTRFDGLIFAGSPIQMHEETAEVRAAARFMSRAFAAGTISFGSCAGLQIATVAAGGSVRPRAGEMAAGFARGIWRTEAGRDHPLLRGRPGAWDAPAMHSAVVDRLPDGGTALARTADTMVQAAEIRSGAGVAYGVQYHPEIDLREIAEALAAQSDALVEQDLARDRGAVERYAGSLEALNDAPDRRDLAWQLGLDAEVTQAERRRREVTNFLRMLRRG